ncbi:alpha/beta hydrolase family protein [Radiobacillus kanasensis]|uniref:alpha/beta hydrolase family protein n=1 Tax=Radiobacillus kanasensis TaxID=2844358 RepID=UPI001E2DE22B|nr:alpha/beta hydrolase family protein [Radiobacillus kanasensis]UFT98746.1 alpha/beta hydrolase family protein [Radiobacillus kanasensis]
MSIESFIDLVYQHKSKENKAYETEEKRRVQLQKLLGDFNPYRNPHMDKSLVLEEKVELDGYTRERFTFEPVQHLRIIFYVLTPSNNQRTYPSVIALAGHGEGVKEIVGLDSTGNEIEEKDLNDHHFAVQLVRRGIKVFAPELIGIGERMLPVDQGLRNNSCLSIASKLQLLGLTITGLRVEEIRRLIDVMHAFADVENSRIGMMGYSGGGVVASYTVALDTRVRGTAILSCANTFFHSLLAINHCIDNYNPHLLDFGEFYDVLSLIAPRPLFITSGMKDTIFPKTGFLEVVTKLEQLYAEIGSTTFAHDLFTGGHEVNGRIVFDWMKEQL